MTTSQASGPNTSIWVIALWLQMIIHAHITYKIILENDSGGNLIGSNSADRSKHFSKSCTRRD